MKTIFAARQNADGMEGRGPMIPIAHFTKEEDAKACAKGKGVMGVGDGDVIELPLFDNMKDYTDYKSGEARKRALSKLTREDKLALGIKD